jgi:hypothetical protein
MNELPSMSADELDDPYLVAPGTIAQDAAEVDVGAQFKERSQRAEPFALEVSVDTDLAADMLVFLGKVQIGDAMSACRHPRTVRFLADFARQIQNAGQYVREQRERA